MLVKSQQLHKQCSSELVWFRLSKFWPSKVLVDLRGGISVG